MDRGWMDGCNVQQMRQARGLRGAAAGQSAQTKTRNVVHQRSSVSLRNSSPLISQFVTADWLAPPDTHPHRHAHACSSSRRRVAGSSEAGRQRGSPAGGAASVQLGGGAGCGTELSTGPGACRGGRGAQQGAGSADNTRASQAAGRWGHTICGSRRQRVDRSLFLCMSFGFISNTDHSDRKSSFPLKHSGGRAVQAGSGAGGVVQAGGWAARSVRSVKIT